MTKKYLMREIIEKEVELTDEDVENIAAKNRAGYNIRLLDDVDQYMEQMNVTWRRWDLEDFLRENNITPTEERLHKFMENNPTLNNDCSYGWDILDYGLSNCNFKEDDVAKKYIVKDPNFVIEVRKQYENDGIHQDTDEDGELLYKIYMEDEVHDNYCTEDETESIIANLLFKRDYEEVE